MRIPLARAAALVLAAASATPRAADENGALRTGAAAFTDWSTEAPGVARLIRPHVPPVPYASQSARNAWPPAGERRAAGLRGDYAAASRCRA